MKTALQRQQNINRQNNALDINIVFCFIRIPSNISRQWPTVHSNPFCNRVCQSVRGVGECCQQGVSKQK